MSHPLPYSKMQIAEMMRLAKLRGFPIERMTLRIFIDYLKIKAPDIINAARCPRPQFTEPRASLSFDGEYLYWQQPGSNKHWPAYSGKEKFWGVKNFSTKAQSIPDDGPLPEGGYSVRQGRYQELPDSPLKEFQGRYLDWTPWGGTWPGWEGSWGNHRVWLEPLSSTNTYGRSGFSIHGGAEPGSEGCIDLVGGMADFAARFRHYGKDMHLTVSYEKHRRETTPWGSLPSASPSHHK